MLCVGYPFCLTELESYTVKEHCLPCEPSAGAMVLGPQAYFVGHWRRPLGPQETIPPRGDHTVSNLEQDCSTVMGWKLRSAEEAGSHGIECHYRTLGHTCGLSLTTTFFTAAGSGTSICAVS